MTPIRRSSASWRRISRGTGSNARGRAGGGARAPTGSTRWCSEVRGGCVLIAVVGVAGCWHFRKRAARVRHPPGDRSAPRHLLRACSARGPSSRARHRAGRGGFALAFVVSRYVQTCRSRCAACACGRGDSGGAATLASLMPAARASRVDVTAHALRVTGRPQADDLKTTQELKRSEQLAGTLCRPVGMTTTLDLVIS